jgi:hypothetical protein
MSFSDFIKLFIGSVVLFFILKKWSDSIKLNEELVQSAKKAYLKALKGTNKEDALLKGRYYVSLLPEKSKLLAEISIQNDLAGMDDAIKLKRK